MAWHIRLEQSSFIALIVLLFSSLTAHAARICYNPDGSVATGDVDCSPTSDVSTCCGASYACLSNNLCVATVLTDANSTGGYQYARGTCTDSSWNSDSCPKFCDNATNNDALYSGEFMESCGVSGVQSYICLNGNSYDCDTGENVVTFSGPAPTYVYNPAQTDSRGTATATATTSTTASTTTTAAPSATSSAAAASGGSSNAVSIGVGVGVGVPLGLAVLFGAFYFYRRNVKSKARHQAIPSSDPNEGPETKQPALYGGAMDGMGSPGISSPAPQYSDYVGHEQRSYEMQKQHPVPVGELAGDHQMAPMELDARREAQELP